MTTKEFVDKIELTAAGYPSEIFSIPGKVYSCVNPYSYHIVKKNSELYGKLDGIFVDGMTMCWWLRLLWGKKIPRLSFDMAGMAVDLFQRLDEKGCSEDIYIIGARQEELEATVGQFRKAYPRMKINGYRNGYFSSQEERRKAIKDIVERNPSFVVVGMGSPLQERFVVDLRNAGYRGIAFTCGGFLHQTTERINYYPAWVDRLNLRAFYRLLHEKRMFRRLWQVLVAFPMRFAIDSLRNPKESKLP